MPELATHALLEGLDSPSLRELAGSRPAEQEENRALLAAAVTEIGLQTPSPSEAHWFLVRELATQILDGTLSPVDAARRIQWEHWEQMGRPEELVVFVGLASEWEDHGVVGPVPAADRRGEIERDIVDAARALLDGN